MYSSADLEILQKAIPREGRDDVTSFVIENHRVFSSLKGLVSAASLSDRIRRGRITRAPFTSPVQLVGGIEQALVLYRLAVEMGLQVTIESKLHPERTSNLILGIPNKSMNLIVQCSGDFAELLYKASEHAEH